MPQDPKPETGLHKAINTSTKVALPIGVVVTILASLGLYVRDSALKRIDMVEESAVVATKDIRNLQERVIRLESDAIHAQHTLAEIKAGIRDMSVKLDHVLSRVSK